MAFLSKPIQVDALIEANSCVLLRRRPDVIPPEWLLAHAEPERIIPCESSRIMIDGDVTIRALLPADAFPLTRCFERCYGRSYVVADFYDPSAIAARIASGSLRSVVAVTGAGEIVGHMGLSIRDRAARTVDAGNSIVDPRHRGRQLVVRLASGVTALCREAGFLGFHHYPTTAHPIMQRMAVSGGGIETGIMLDYIPSGTEYRELDGEPQRGRLAVVVVYQPLAPTPVREVFASARLAEAITEIYARGRLPRTVRRSSRPLPSSATRLDVHSDPRRGLLRIAIAEAGRDLRDRVRQLNEASDAAIRQIDFRMTDHALPAAVDQVRELGFFFSAVLPEYLDGDVLRLQRPSSMPANLPQLVTDDAHRLFRTIEADRPSTLGM